MLRTLHEIFGNTTYTAEKWDDAAWQYTPAVSLNVNQQLVNKLTAHGWVTTEGIFNDVGTYRVIFTQNGWVLSITHNQVFLSHPSDNDAEALTFPLP
jgi:hypothetical protein